MTQEPERVVYDRIQSYAVVVAPDGQAGPQPAVLLAHTWAGRNAAMTDIAMRVAEQGYVAIALDLYGEGVTGDNPETCAGLMEPLLSDRAELQRRLRAGFEMAAERQDVMADRIAIAGFCFGGLCALDLARCCPQLRAAVSFHGLLNPPRETNFEQFRASVLILHGHDDPLVQPDDVQAMYRELSAADADWQFHHFGGTLHGFTNPQAEDYQAGIVYNERSANRAWRLAFDFLDECLR